MKKKETKEQTNSEWHRRCIFEKKKNIIIVVYIISISLTCYIISSTGAVCCEKEIYKRHTFWSWNKSWSFFPTCFLFLIIFLCRRFLDQPVFYSFFFRYFFQNVLDFVSPTESTLSYFFVFSLNILYAIAALTVNFFWFRADLIVFIYVWRTGQAELWSALGWPSAWGAMGGCWGNHRPPTRRENWYYNSLWQIHGNIKI